MDSDLCWLRCDKKARPVSGDGVKTYLCDIHAKMFTVTGSLAISVGNLSRSGEMPVIQIGTKKKR